MMIEAAESGEAFAAELHQTGETSDIPTETKGHQKHQQSSQLWQCEIHLFFTS